MLKAIKTENKKIAFKKAKQEIMQKLNAKYRTYKINKYTKPKGCKNNTKWTCSSVGRAIDS